MDSYLFLFGVGMTHYGFVVVFVQILTVPASGLLILLRLTSILKDRTAWIYWVVGTFQISLGAIDVYLLIVNNNMTRISRLIFLGLNLLSGAFILTDIYKDPRSKRNKR